MENDRVYTWLRLHHSMRLDPKILQVANATNEKYQYVVGFWTQLLILASESPMRGKLVVNSKDTPLSIKNIADLTLMKPKKVAILMELFRENGMLKNNEIAHWDKRQYETSTERSQRYRAQKRADVANASVTNETQCNAEVLQMQRGGVANATYRSDTDTDTDIKIEGASSASTILVDKSGCEADDADDDANKSIYNVPDSQIPEMLNPKSKVFETYVAITARYPTHNDRRVVEQWTELPNWNEAQAIEAMHECAARAKTAIGSLSYFKNAVMEKLDGRKPGGKKHYGL